jgi:RNA-directed DNA polymerase
VAHGPHGREGAAGQHVLVDGKTGETLSSPPVTPKLHPLAEQAARAPGRVVWTLAPLRDEALLREAYRHTSKASAAGSAGGTAKPYAEPRDPHRRDLHERRRSGRSQAAPVARVWREQEDGRQRPIGKPTCEEKLVQRAVAMLVDASYEHDCADGSYGFRQGRSPQDARHAGRERCRRAGMGWSVEAASSGYCDRLDRTRLRAVLRKRVQDGGLWRLIGKWLHAGGMAEGGLSHPETGVGQGGVMAPMLANIFLHHVRDEGFAREVQPRMPGRCFLMRFADDGVMGGEWDADARTLMAVLPKRLARFGRTLHPTKTALVSFRKPTGHTPAGRGNGTVDFLGFTP